MIVTENFAGTAYFYVVTAVEEKTGGDAKILEVLDDSGTGETWGTWCLSDVGCAESSEGGLDVSCERIAL